RPCGYFCRPAFQGVENCLVILRVDHSWILAFVSVACFLHCFERNTSFSGGAAHLAEQIANHLVTDSSYSYPPTLLHKFDHHASPGKRFAGARWSLDRKH